MRLIENRPGFQPLRQGHVLDGEAATPEMFAELETPGNALPPINVASACTRTEGRGAAPIRLF